MPITCKHCGEILTVRGRIKGGRRIGTKHMAKRDRVIQHLKAHHPDVAAGFPRGFTRAKGFGIEQHADY